MLWCRLCSVECTATTVGFSSGIRCVWHSYKYCIELIYRAFLPFIKFLEQGNSLQVGSILPCKVKVIHMEKTLLGLMLATSSNRGGLDERATALLSS